MPVNQIKTETVPWLREENNDSKSGNLINNELGKDAFLELLVTELKYQDPLSPMENKEFISQMANFSSLEQMQNLNNSFAKIMPILNMQQASGIIGKELYYRLSDDSDAIYSGAVTAVRMKESIPYYLVDGQEISPSMVVQILDKDNSNSEILDEIVNSLNEIKEQLVPQEVETDE